MEKVPNVMEEAADKKDREEKEKADKADSDTEIEDIEDDENDEDEDRDDGEQGADNRVLDENVGAENKSIEKLDVLKQQENSRGPQTPFVL